MGDQPVTKADFDGLAATMKTLADQMAALSTTTTAQITTLTAKIDNINISNRNNNIRNSNNRKYNNRNNQNRGGEPIRVRGENSRVIEENDSLRSRGIRFPDRDKEGLAPIFKHTADSGSTFYHSSGRNINPATLSQQSLYGIEASVQSQRVDAVKVETENPNEKAELQSKVAAWNEIEKATSGHDLISSSKISIESNKFEIVKTDMNQTEGKQEFVVNIPDLQIPSLGNSPTSSEEQSKSQQCSMDQQHPIGEINTTVKLSQVNNCVKEIDIHGGSISEKTSTALSAISETESESPIQLVDSKQKGIKLSFEDVTTFANAKTKRAATHVSSSWPLFNYDHKTSSHEYCDGQITVPSFSISTTKESPCQTLKLFGTDPPNLVPSPPPPPLTPPWLEEHSVYLQLCYSPCCLISTFGNLHSPYVTVYESLLFSAWLRLPSDVNTQIRKMFVEEVMELIELIPIRDALVGFPRVNGLSTEQRKRLTVDVELVANPSIIFMDEPTSGHDARAAAIVMRTVRNTVDTRRTVVCTIHQPNIDIFEAFDELLVDDSRGVAKALNETVCVSDKCTGIIIIGKYYFRIDHIGEGARWRRTFGQEIYSPFLLAFTESEGKGRDPTTLPLPPEPPDAGSQCLMISLSPPANLQPTKIKFISVNPCCVKADYLCFIAEESEKDLEKTTVKLVICKLNPLLNLFSQTHNHTSLLELFVKAYTIWTEAKLINFVQFINSSKVQVNYYYSFDDLIIHIPSNSYMLSDVMPPWEKNFSLHLSSVNSKQCSKRAITHYSHITSLFPHNSLLIQPTLFHYKPLMWDPNIYSTHTLHQQFCPLPQVFNNLF